MRFGYVNYPFLGQESIWAAEAAECADEQGKFWEYHDFLFENWNGENQGTFSKENLKNLAADMGLDTAKFNECMDTGRMEAIVQQDLAFSQGVGVSSTPTFAINGKALQGALPFENFQQIIEQELQKAEG